MNDFFHKNKWIHSIRPSKRLFKEMLVEAEIFIFKAFEVRYNTKEPMY